MSLGNKVIFGLIKFPKFKLLKNSYTFTHVS